jgi:hypothetical protein
VRRASDDRSDDGYAYARAERRQRSTRSAPAREGRALALLARQLAPEPYHLMLLLPLLLLVVIISGAASSSYSAALGVSTLPEPPSLESPSTTTTTIVSPAAAAAAAAATTFDPPLILWDGAHLIKGRQQIAAGTASASLRASVTKMNATAYQSLPEYDPGPLRPRYYSVMNKTSVAPSGDKHDFLVYASYYWPCNAICGKDAPPPNGLCPDFCNNGSMWLHAAPEYSWCRPCDDKRDADGKPIGQPWAGHDGYNWPGAEVDREQIDNVWDYVLPLTVAWWYGCGRSTCVSHHEQRYLERAAEIWRYWFIDPNTSMNPNLDYSDICASPPLSRPARPPATLIQRFSWCTPQSLSGRCIECQSLVRSWSA